MLRFFRNPQSCKTFTHADWNDVFEMARTGKLLARIAWVVRQEGLEEYVPPEARWILDSAWLRFLHSRRQLFWELDRIHLAVRPGETLPDAEYADAPVILLKGAAYLAAGFPWGEGRSSVDVDVLVSRENLPEIERRLTGHGWLSSTVDAYDDHYYRQWMHEIPPLYHVERNTVLDVHHNILPTLGRIKVDPRVLWEDSVPLAGQKDAESPAAKHFRILSPCDMILHSATHLFQSGEFENEFRDVVDLDAMFRHYLPEADFADRLFARAEKLNLERPLFYALRYAHKMLGTPVSREVLRESRKLGGNFLITAAMDQLVPRALMPGRLGKTPKAAPTARKLLLVRSHFLRMPLRMLIPHLWTKWRKKKSGV